MLAGVLSVSLCGNLVTNAKFYVVLIPHFILLGNDLLELCKFCLVYTIPFLKTNPPLCHTNICADNYDFHFLFFPLLELLSV